MKVYQVWGIDKSYRFKWMARLSGFMYWYRRGNKAMAKSSLLCKFGKNIK